MVNNASFREKVFAFAQRSESLGEPQVAFGLKQFDERIVASLLKAQRWARIVVVSPPGVDSRGMQTVASDNPEETLARLLATDQVEGIIRGTLDDFKTIEAYERLSNEKCTLVPALLENTMGQQFFVEPVSNPDGWDKGDRLLRGLGLAEFVMRWEIVPRIAVYAGARRDTYERRKEDRDGVIGTLNQTYDDAEWIVDEFVKKGRSYNPHSPRGTVGLYSPAISCLGAFRTPAVRACG